MSVDTEPQCYQPKDCTDVIFWEFPQVEPDDYEEVPGATGGEVFVISNDANDEQGDQEDEPDEDHEEEAAVAAIVESCTSPPREIFVYDQSDEPPTPATPYQESNLTPARGNLSTKVTDISEPEHPKAPRPTEKGPKRFTFDGLTPASSLVEHDEARDTEENGESSGTADNGKDVVRDNEADAVSLEREGLSDADDVGTVEMAIKSLVDDLPEPEIDDETANVEAVETIRSADIYDHAVTSQEEEMLLNDLPEATFSIEHPRSDNEDVAGDDEEAFNGNEPAAIIRSFTDVGTQTEDEDLIGIDSPDQSKHEAECETAEPLSDSAAPELVEQVSKQAPRKKEELVVDAVFEEALRHDDDEIPTASSAAIAPIDSPKSDNECNENPDDLPIADSQLEARLHRKSWFDFFGSAEENSRSSFPNFGFQNGWYNTFSGTLSADEPSLKNNLEAVEEPASKSVTSDVESSLGNVRSTSVDEPLNIIEQRSTAQVVTTLSSTDQHEQSAAEPTAINSSSFNELESAVPQVPSLPEYCSTQTKSVESSEQPFDEPLLSDPILDRSETSQNVAESADTERNVGRLQLSPRLQSKRRASRYLSSRSNHTDDRTCRALLDDDDMTAPSDEMNNGRDDDGVPSPILLESPPSDEMHGTLSSPGAAVSDDVGDDGGEEATGRDGKQPSTRPVAPFECSSADEERAGVTETPPPPTPVEPTVATITTAPSETNVISTIGSYGSGPAAPAVASDCTNPVSCTDQSTTNLGQQSPDDIDDDNQHLAMVSIDSHDALQSPASSTTGGGGGGVSSVADFCTGLHLLCGGDDTTAAL